MRFLLTFFALFTPLAWLLWFLAGDMPTQPDMAVTAAASIGDSVLSTSDIPRIPVSGEINSMKKGLFQRFHESENYVVYWVSFEGIERVDGKARIQGISCALFGKPKDGRESIRIRMEAPYLEGDPVQLIAAQREGARQLVLGGGVKVYDELGRVVAELERVEIDLEAETVRSDGEVFFRSAEENAELRGRGLRSDLALNDAKLLTNVRARLPIGDDKGGVVSLACAGPATMVRDEKQGTTVVTLNNAARIDHRDGHGTCGTITARLRDSKTEKFEVDKIVLQDSVVFELDRALADGIEEFRAHRITISGDTDILVEGAKEPVRAVRRGALDAFGLADRVLDIDTPRMLIQLRPKAESKVGASALVFVRFSEGLNIRDREGPGRLSAGWLEYDARAGELEIKERLVASGPGRRLEAARMVMRRPPDRKDVVVMGIYGKKELEVKATGKLGPLVRGGESLYKFRCDGPLIVEQYNESRVTVTASDNVVVAGREAPIFRCGRVFAILVDKELRRVEASGGIHATDPETGAKLTADKLDYQFDKSKEILLRGESVARGKLAVVEQPDRTVRARVLRYSEDGTFLATGDIEADVTLQGKSWKFRAERAEGIAPKDKGAPPHFLATGGVVAEGPEGERLTAERMEYVREKSSLTLSGKPARLRRGDQFFYEGEQLRLLITETDKEYSVEHAETAGPARLIVSPPKKAGGAAPRVARWEVDLSGPTRFEGGVVQIPDEARLRAYDAKGVLILKAMSRETRIEVERTKQGFLPRKLVCRRAVSAETFKGGKRATRFEAKQISYVVNSREVDVQGPGRLWQGEEKEPSRFGEAQFGLTDEGIELNYARGLEVPLGR